MDGDGARAIPVGKPAAFSLSVQDGIGRLVFDVPGEKVNTFGEATLSELAVLLGDLEQRTDLQCLLIMSGKPGTFIAGADLHTLEAIPDAETGSRSSQAGQELMNRIDDLPYPTVAVIDGAAAGGGLELALACDYRVVSDNPKTQLSLPEVTLGIVPGWGGSYRLPRRIGLRQALRMILAGRPVDGKRAERMRLADACVPAAFLDGQALAFARTVMTPAGRRGVEKHRRVGGIPRFLAERTPVGRAVLFRAARRELAERAGDGFQAPLDALRLLRRTVHASRPRALRLECAVVGRLLVTPECRNLVRLFFIREQVKQAAEGGSPAVDVKISRAAVLGAGVMGGRIAWLFSRAGLPVAMKDIAWDAVGRGYGAALEAWQELARRGRADERQVNLGMHRIRGIVDYRSFGKPDVVIEAVVEKLEVKRAVLAEVERRVDDGTLLASNTSSLSITEIGGSLAHPERFVGMHFFNPPTIMPLVEVVAGARSDARRVQAAAKVAMALGKTPIVVADCPGFLVNRLLMSYLNEAARLLEEGADYLAVDRVLTDFGMPMGPFRLLDEIGLDIAREVGRSLARSYGSRAQPAPLFGRLEARPELLGRKSGGGFYRYRGSRADPNPEMAALARPAGGGRPRGAREPDVVQRTLLAMVNEAARTLDERIVATPAELDLALVLGTGFPAWRGGILRYADSLGSRAVRDLLAGFAKTVDPGFAPSRLIEDLATSGRGFYQL